MSPDPDFHESTDAWLDGSGSTEQGRILQEILSDKPGSAQEFAAISRTHATLELTGLSEKERIHRASLLLLKTPVSSRLLANFRGRAAWWPAAAALLILGAVWLTGYFTNIPNTPATQPATKKAPVQRLTPGALTPVAQLPPADPEYGKFMDSFIIPEFQASGVSSEEAVAVLTDKVTAAGHDGFQVEIEASPEVAAATPVHLKLKYQPASTLLQLIALQSGLKVYPTGKSFRLSLPQPAASPKTEFHSTTVGRWESFVQSQGLDHTGPATTSENAEAIVQKKSTDESEAPAAAPLPDTQSIRAVLLSAVNEAPDVVEIIADPLASRRNRTMEIRCAPGLQAMLALLLSGQSAPGTLTYDMMWANVPDWNTLEQILPSLADPNTIERSGGGTLLGEPAMSALVKALRTSPGIKLETNPPLLIAPGRGVTTLDTDSPDEAIAENTWTGRRSRITSKPSGSNVTGELQIKYQTLQADGSIGVIERITPLNVPVGKTLILEASKTGQGEIMFLTPRQQEAIPYGIKVPGKPGFVLSPYALEQGMVDVDGLPKRTKVKCPYTGKVFRVPE